MNYFGRLKSWIRAKIANAQTQKYKIELAILSAIILLFIFSFSTSKSVRFFCGLHPGIVIVALSVACELVCDWRTEKSLIERLKKFFGICLVIGLILEVNEAVKSDIEVEKLRTNLALLNKSTIELAHEYDLSTNALAEATVRLAQAHSEAQELEAKFQPREITKKQYGSFLKFFARFANVPDKKPVWIICSNPSTETMNFVSQIRKMLDEVGYRVNPNDPLPFKAGVGTGYVNPGVFNSPGLNLPGFPISRIGVVVSPDAPAGNWPERAFLLFGAFSQIGLECEFAGGSDLKHDEIAIFVPTR